MKGDSRLGGKRVPVRKISQAQKRAYEVARNGHWDQEWESLNKTATTGGGDHRTQGCEIPRFKPITGSLWDPRRGVNRGEYKGAGWGTRSTGEPGFVLEGKTAANG